jgi:hypothetical protein
MNVETQEQNDLKTAQDLEARNKEVERAYLRIIKGAKALLSPFDSKKYRTWIQVEHSKSGKETNLINESICCFWNITLTCNKVGYKMIYFCYDEEALNRFGARLYNRAIRQLFKHTMQEKNRPNIEDCVRVTNPGKVQSFFLNRLAQGENDFITITVQENN